MKMLRRIFDPRRNKRTPTSAPPRRRRCLPERLEDRRLLVATVDIASSGPISVAEDGVESLVMTFSRSETDDALAVPFEISGSATFRQDYEPREVKPNTLWVPESAGSGETVRGTAVFAAGESSVDIEFRPLIDLELEFSEDVVVTVVGNDEFGPVTGAASLIQRREETQYFAVDSQNRLAQIDVESGAIQIIGGINSTQTIRDIAFTENGDLFAISFDHLFELDLQTINNGLVGTRFMGFHGIPAATALVDARDEDFGSEPGDLLAVGDGRLRLQQLELDEIAGNWEITSVFPVFDIEQALANLSIPSQYRSPGDLDYSSSGDLILSATLPDAVSDSLIQIKTPGSTGLIDESPVTSQDPGRPFSDLQGLAFDGRDSYAFAGFTGLVINQFNLDATASFELIGRAYEVSTDATASGLIEGDPVDPPVISFTTLAQNPDDLPAFAQPTSWLTQRSDLHDIVIDLNAPIDSVGSEAIELTNLGTSPVDTPESVTLDSDQIQLSNDGTRITVQLDQAQLPDGRYQMVLPPAITRGETLTIQGTPSNRFFVLEGDWDGNGVVDLLDIRSFAYWFGQDLPTAPRYVDLDGSGVIDLGDADRLKQALGKFILTPGFPNPVVTALLDPQAFDSALRSSMDPLDVNGSGAVTPLDALGVLNRLGGGFPSPLDWRYDVNRDGNVSPLDALRVLNAIAQQANTGNDAPDGESTATEESAPLGETRIATHRDEARDSWFAVQQSFLPTGEPRIF